MQNEIKFSKILESYGDPTTELDLDAFLRLFVNHRPVWGIGMAQIQTALQTLSKGKNSIGRSELFEALMTEGEKMTQEELDEAELILMGEGNHFPEQIDVDTLSHKILGFDDVDKEETPESDSFK
jgi:cilia- and flagella-associated protein 251